MKFLGIAASHRPDSSNLRLLKIAASIADAPVGIVDYSVFDVPLYNDAKAETTPESVAQLANIFNGVDGIMIASPEYNWSYPGTLKNGIDWLSRLPQNPLKGKTALLMCASPSPRGGIMGLQHLKLPLEAMQMFVFPKMLPVGNAHQALGAHGFSDAKNAELCQSIVSGFCDFTRALRK